MSRNIEQCKKDIKLLEKELKRLQDKEHWTGSLGRGDIIKNEAGQYFMLAALGGCKYGLTCIQGWKVDWEGKSNIGCFCADIPGVFDSLESLRKAIRAKESYSLFGKHDPTSKYCFCCLTL